MSDRETEADRQKQRLRHRERQGQRERRRETQRDTEREKYAQVFDSDLMWAENKGRWQCVSERDNSQLDSHHCAAKGVSVALTACTGSWAGRRCHCTNPCTCSVHRDNLTQRCALVHATQTSISSSHAGDGEEWTDPTHCSTAALAMGGGGGGEGRGGGAKISRHFGMSFYQ